MAGAESRIRMLSHFNSCCKIRSGIRRSGCGAYLYNPGGRLHRPGKGRMRNLPSIPMHGEKLHKEVTWAIETCAYPRVQGRTEDVADDLLCSARLSPYAGKQRRGAALGGAASTSIPAYGEAPCGSGLYGGRPSVYPRVRGSNKSMQLARQPGWRLSPRAGKNPAGRQPVPMCQALIPACGEEPASMSARSLVPSVYPRVRGSNSTYRHTQKQLWRLSPRAGKNPGRPKPHAGNATPIPVRGEEPLFPWRRPSPSGAYPRVRGSTPGPGEIACPQKRLSPRAGKNLWGIVCGSFRLSPRAGKQPGRFLVPDDGYRLSPRAGKQPFITAKMGS